MQPPVSKLTRDFLRIVMVSTAVGFGVATASLVSLRHTEAGFDFDFNAGTVLAFAGGAALAWGYWRVILKRISRATLSDAKARAEEARHRTRFIIYSIVLGLFGVGCLLYPLRFVRHENLSPIVQGLLMAFVVVAAVGGVLWYLARMIAKLDQNAVQPSDDDDDDKLSPD